MKKVLSIILLLGLSAGIAANSDVGLNTKKSTVWQKAKGILCSKPVALITVLCLMAGTGYVGYRTGDMIGWRSRGAADVFNDGFGRLSRFVPNRYQLHQVYSESETALLSYLREQERQAKYFHALQELTGNRFTEEQKANIEIAFTSAGNQLTLEYVSDDVEVKRLLQYYNSFVAGILADENMQVDCCDRGLRIIKNV